MAMKTSFTDYSAKVPENLLSRRWAGKKPVAEPAVSGYHFIQFGGLPTDLVNGNYIKADVRSNIIPILSAACLSVTPPGGTLSKVEFTGLGGVKWAVPGNIDYGNSITIKFLEFSGLPILQIMHGWVKMIRDYRTGIASSSSEGTKYSKTNYASHLFYWTTTPNITEVEYAVCYDGVYPLKDPQDLFTSDVETVGRIDTEIEFNVDYAWHEDWVEKKCITFANSVYGSKEKIEGYGNYT